MRIIRFSFWIVIFALSTLSCVKENDPSEEVIDYVKVGNSVPDFQVTDGEGNSFDASSFIGKRSLLVLFSTTCKDCQRELPKVEAVWRELKEDDSCRVITIARQQSKEDTDKYWRDHGFTLLKYLDTDRSVFSLFASSTIPRLYIVNEKGVVEWMETERLTLTVEELLEKIKGKQ